MYFVQWRFESLGVEPRYQRRSHGLEHRVCYVGVEEIASVEGAKMRLRMHEVPRDYGWGSVRPSGVCGGAPGTGIILTNSSNYLH